MVDLHNKLLSTITRETSGRQFFPVIDGLRFVAILGVVLYHIQDYFFTKTGEQNTSLFLVPAKTVELLCTNWLKTMKYDPILLLDNLNPVLNEHVCEEVTRVLLRVASTIDCNASPSFNHAAAAAV
ncbi:MAG: hypothetical protein ACKPA7_04800, partial [Sphaerospermopsis kisseleviana]